MIIKKIKLVVLNLKSNQFLKASFFSAFSTSLKIITALIIGKIVAMKAGAEGMAIYGQLLNFVTIIMVFAGGSINDGIIKYVSEFKESKTIDLKHLFSTAFRILLISSIIIGILLVLFSEPLSIYILHDIKYRLVFVLFGIFIFFYGLNNFLLAILNGFKSFIKFNSINIIINIISLIITLILINYFGLFGALLGVVLNQSFLFVFTIFLLKNENWFKKENFIAKFDKNIFRLLLRYASFAFFTIAVTPIVTFIIRNIIIENVSLSAAGQFEFISRISSSALLFFSLTVSTYYLPRISEIFSKKELLSEIKNTYKIIIPIAFILLLGVFAFRFLIISILASDAFKSSEGLFLYQLLGVFLRLIAQVCGFVLLAKAHIKSIISLEFILNIFYILFTLYFVRSYGLIGCSYAFLAYNFIYVITVLVIFRRLLNKNKLIIS